jgi:hypothetical protein
MLTALGQVVGLLLDRNASRMPGSGVLLEQEGDLVIAERRLYWRDVDVWRVEHGGEWSLCDGITVGHGSGDSVSESVPVRRGWPSYWMQLVFPLRGHYWGRMGDDYYMESVHPAGEHAFISLKGTDSERQGHLLVDDDGFIVQFARPHGSFSLVRDVVRPVVRDELFVLPGHGG